MQKTFIKCVFRIRVSRFLHRRKILIRRFQKKKIKTAAIRNQNYSEPRKIFTQHRLRPKGD
jgi:hypothetical protein